MRETFRPQPYQVACRDEILAKPAYVLGMDMSLGKTATVLWALDDLVCDSLQVARVLVVGPKRVVQETWPNELEKWDVARHLAYRVWTAEDFGYRVEETVAVAADAALGVEGVVNKTMRPADQKALRAKVLADRSPVHLVSRDHLYWLTVALGKAWPYEMLVIDESTGFADTASRRFKAVKTIRRHAPQLQRLVLMTGTLIPEDDLEQLYTQMLLVDGGARLGRTKEAFRAAYMTPDKRSRDRVFSWKARPGAREQVAEAIRDVATVVRAEDWRDDLPAQIPVVRRVRLSPAGRRAYEAMERDLLLPLAGDAQALAINQGVLFGKLHQLANGTVFDQEGVAHDVHTDKLEALLEIHEEHPAPLLIFYSHVPDRDRILRRVPGAVDVAKVRHLEADWNAGKIRRLVAHPASIGHGLNLQYCPGADVVWFGLTPSNDLFAQANKRLPRPGRSAPVRNIILLSEGTIDEDLLGMVTVKGVGQGVVLNALALRAAKLKSETKKPRTSGEGGASGVA